MTDYVRGNSLTGLTTLARVTMTFPAHDLWSDGVASGTIKPAQLVEPAGASAGISGNSEAAGKFRKVAGAPASGATGKKRYAVAMRPVEVTPSSNGEDGPIEVVNQDILNGEYLRRVYDGVVMVTNASASAYTVGDMVTWDGGGTPGDTDTASQGCWKVTTDPLVAFGEVVSYRPLGASTGADGCLLEFRIL